MNVPVWALVVAGILFAYLIITDIRLHRRIKRLEHIVRKLEGVKPVDRKDEIRKKMMHHDGAAI